MAIEPSPMRLTLLSSPSEEQRNRALFEEGAKLAEEDLQMRLSARGQKVLSQQRVKSKTSSGSSKFLPTKGRVPQQIRLKSGELLQSQSGRDMGCCPNVTFGTKRKVANSLKRIDAWLYDEAVKEAAGNDFVSTQLRALDPKKLSSQIATL